jgi:GT2 family glycosyltransferase
MKKVSLLMLTIDRYELTRQTWETNLRHAGRNFELEGLICDNGSTDRRTPQYFQTHHAVKHLRVNSQNEGVARAFNQLYLWSTGDYICLMGNDIELPQGWLVEMVKYADGVPDSGIIGMDWGHSGMPPLTQKFGIHGHWLTPVLDKVFGVWLMRRAVIDKLGFFCERFHPYALEDSDFNNRVNRAGLNSCYVPNTHFRSRHVGVGEHDSGQYRAMKNESMGKNLAVLSDRIANYTLRGLVEPLPEMRPPL